MAADTKRGAVLHPLDIEPRRAVDVLRNPPTLNAKRRVECGCADELRDDPCPIHGQLFSPTDAEADALGLPRVPKRGEDEQVVSIAGRVFTVGEVREMLREQGLHVVTAADKAVLDAMADVSNEDLEYWVSDDYYCPASCEKPGAAELARREAAK